MRKLSHYLFGVTMAFVAMAAGVALAVAVPQWNSNITPAAMALFNATTGFYQAAQVDPTTGALLTIGTSNPSAPAAGNVAYVSVANVSTMASTTYATGTVVGPALTLSALYPTGLTGLTLASASAMAFDGAFAGASLDLVLFRVFPSASTIADNSTFSLAAADRAKIVQSVHLTDCSLLGAPAMCQATGLATELAGLSTTPTMYGVLVNRGSTITLTSQAANEVTVQLSGVY